MKSKSKVIFIIILLILIAISIYSLIKTNSYQVKLEALKQENLDLKNKVGQLTESIKLNSGNSVFPNDFNSKHKKQISSNRDELTQYQEQLLKYQQYIPDKYPTHKVVISRGFLPQSNHPAYDLAGSRSDTIYAAGAGVVEFTKKSDKFYGTCLLLDHLNSFKTFYGHNQINLVKTGEMVNKGQPIAKIGMTGQTTAPHLHFEIRYKGEKVDPGKLLKNNGE